MVPKFFTPTLKGKEVFPEKTVVLVISSASMAGT